MTWYSVRVPTPRAKGPTRDQTEDLALCVDQTDDLVLCAGPYYFARDCGVLPGRRRGFEFLAVERGCPHCGSLDS